MSKYIAYQVLIEDADRRYHRSYLALQCWTLMLLPLSWILVPLAPKDAVPTWPLLILAVWGIGVGVLQKRWRKAAKRSERLRDEKLSQLVAEVAGENERLWRMLRDEE